MEENVKIEKLNETEYKIVISVPTAAVDLKFDNFFKNIKGKAQVPGFRAGHAPISLLKQYYGQKARAPVAGMLAQEYYDKAVKDNSLNPIGQPEIKDFNSASDFPGRFGFDNSYSVEMTIEVIPKIDPIGYTGLELKIDEIDENELLNNRLNELKDQFAERKQITDRGALVGDSLVIDFVGYIDDKPFDGGTAKGFNLNKLGGGNFIPGFEEQVVGVKPGETKKIFVTFPEDYHAANLAAKNASFDVTVHSIVESKPAEENDDLAMMSGYTTLTELKEKMQKDAAKEKRALLRQKTDQQIIEKLIEANSFDVPKKLVELEFNHLIKQVNRENAPQEFLNQIKKDADFNVRRAILSNAIYEKEKSTEVTPQELDELLEEHSKANSKTKDELISALYNSGQMDNFVGILRFAKVIDFILDNSKKKESEEVK